MKRNGNQLEVEWLAVDRIKRYPANPRKNAGAVSKVAQAIQEFGWRQPIVVDAGMVIVAGDTRYLAALQLQHRKVPVHVAHGLTPAQIKGYRLADNRVAQEAEWDPERLVAEFAGLTEMGFDLAFTGFEPNEINGMGGGLRLGADPDDAPDLPKRAVTQVGDLIGMGPHRLLCGDATDSGAWDTLLGGEQAAMVWTDPPYGVAVNAVKDIEEARRIHRRTDGKLIENDDLDGVDLTEMWSTSLALAWSHSAAGGSWYVAALAGPQHTNFLRVLSDLKVWRQTLQWVKDVFVFGRSDYHYRHESIFYGWKEGGAHTWNGGRSQDTVLEYPRPKRSELHPTMKPVALVKRCIENSSKPNALVVDCFAGSGSTLIACEDAGRRAALIELTPAYCDVIVTRWEQATGQKAQRPKRGAA